MIDITDEKISELCINYYNKSSEEYHRDFKDEVLKKPYDREFLSRFAEYFNPPARMLDVGCGASAQQAVFFKGLGFDVTAIDLSAGNIEVASREITGIDFQEMNMLDLTFEDSSFHGINAFYSIIHLPDHHLAKCFTQFHRVLVSKGKLSIAAHLGDFNGIYDKTEEHVYFREFRTHHLVGKLKDAGFDILYQDERNPIYDFEFQTERVYLIAEKN